MSECHICFFVKNICFTSFSDNTTKKDFKRKENIENIKLGEGNGLSFDDKYEWHT